MRFVLVAVQRFKCLDSDLVDAAQDDILWSQILAAASWYYQRTYKAYPVGKADDKYGNKVWTDLEAISDQLTTWKCNGMFAKLLHALVHGSASLNPAYNRKRPVDDGDVDQAIDQAGEAMAEEVAGEDE